MPTPTVYYVATQDLPAFGIRAGYQITIDGDLATVAFDMNAAHFTPELLARSARRVHVPDAAARVRIG
jgi:hypothetical protein